MEDFNNDGVEGSAFDRLSSIKANINIDGSKGEAESNKLLFSDSKRGPPDGFFQTANRFIFMDAGFNSTYRS